MKKEYQKPELKFISFGVQEDLADTTIIDGSMGTMPSPFNMDMLDETEYE